AKRSSPFKSAPQVAAKKVKPSPAPKKTSKVRLVKKKAAITLNLLPASASCTAGLGDAEIRALKIRLTATEAQVSVLTQERASMRLAQQTAESERASMRLAQQTAESERASMRLAQQTAESERASMRLAQQTAESERASMRLAQQTAESERASMRLALQTAESERASMRLAQQTAESEWASIRLALQNAQSERASTRLAPQLDIHLDTSVCQPRRRLFGFHEGDADPQPLQPDVPTQRPIQRSLRGRQQHHDRRPHLMRPPPSGQFPRIARTCSSRTAFKRDSIALRNLR
ncbi:hypothetical protein JOQ06_004878, partial [Pogonophryne albipinna]